MLAYRLEKFTESFRTCYNSLKANDTHMCNQKLELSFIPVMVCRLIGIRPPPKLLWIDVTLTTRNKLKRTLEHEMQFFYEHKTFQNIVCAMAPILFKPQFVNGWYVLTIRQRPFLSDNCSVHTEFCDEHWSTQKQNKEGKPMTQRRLTCMSVIMKVDN